MKTTMIFLSLLVSLNTFAQSYMDDPARRAEREARDRQQHDVGYLTPGDNPYQPYQPPMPPRPPRPPRPPMPPPPPQHGGYDYYNYGPNYTVRWMDTGLNKMPKIISQTVVIRVQNQLVNEVLLRAVKSQVSIRSITAIMTNGQAINLNHLAITLQNGQEIRAPLDYRYSLRLDRLIIEGNSPNLIGSLGQLNVVLGLAQ